MGKGSHNKGGRRTTTPTMTTCFASSTYFGYEIPDTQGLGSTGGGGGGDVQLKKTDRPRPPGFSVPSCRCSEGGAPGATSFPVGTTHLPFYSVHSTDGKPGPGLAWLPGLAPCRPQRPIPTTESSGPETRRPYTSPGGKVIVLDITELHTSRPASVLFFGPRMG